MQNTIKSNRTVPKEELEKIQEMDWKTYYQEAAPSEAQGLTTCENCGSIVIAREGLTSDVCYKCGNKISP